MAEKFNGAGAQPNKKSPSKKIILPGINVDGARKEFERRSSLVGGSASPKKPSSASPSPPDDAFPLASTVALNKLVESAFKDEQPFDSTPVPETPKEEMGDRAKSAKVNYLHCQVE